MKIALYHNLPSGGALYHFSQVAQALSEAGHELHLYTPETSEAGFVELKSFVTHHVLLPRDSWHQGFFLWNPWRYRNYLKKCLNEEAEWAKLIAKENFDGIYCGQCRVWTEPPLLRFLPKSLPKVLYCQEPKRSFYEDRFLKQMSAWPWWKKIWRLPTVNWMKEQMALHISCADMVLCNSEFSKHKIAKAYPKIQGQTSYIGVDTEDFCPCPLTPVKPQILTVGALDPSKNHNFSLEVAALKPAGIELDVVVVTDRSYGDTAKQLLHLAQTLGVNLAFRERVSRAELVQLYRSSLATVYAPLEEPFGIVSIESQACGTPVIGVAEGGILETLRDGVGGFLVKRSIAEAAEKCARLLKEPKLRSLLSAQAREHVLAHWQKKERIAKTVGMIEGAMNRNEKAKH